MHSNTNFSLSEYQRATLKEMGIICWRQLTKLTKDSDEDCSTKDEEVNSLHLSNKDGSIQRSASLTTQHLKQPTSIAQQVLLLISEADSAHPLVKDVLNTLNLPINATTTVPAGDVEDYSDYLLAWKEALDITFNESILSTPALSNFSPAAKKQLWQILQNCHLFV